jgi:ferrochelatase
MKKGVLVMAYGSPDKLEDIEPYYTDIRRGHKPPEHLLTELTNRYIAIGGGSPLLRITRAQAEGLKEQLGEEYEVFVGMRHWTPWIHEAVEEIKEAGIGQLVGIVMAPHYSGMSIARYIGKVEEAKAAIGADFEFACIQSWGDQPLFIEALMEKIAKARLLFSKEEAENLHVIFTAHSLPEKILSENDPYQEQLLETSRLLADKAGVRHWSFAFQSAGRTQEKWLGPDLLEEINMLSGKGIKSILVCSVGFITDHLEVLYDIDVEGKAKAKQSGIHLERTASLNDHTNLAQLFAKLVKEKFNEF